MKTIELSTGTLLVVKLPNEAVRITAHEESSCVWYMMPHARGWLSRELPSFGFQLLGHPSEITGEVWGMVVEMFVMFGYKNYEVDEQVYDALKATPTESGLSLCAAHNIQESDVLLFKPKEAVQESGSDPVCNEVTKKELSQLLNDVWSEWDESVKKRVVEMQKKIIQS